MKFALCNELMREWPFERQCEYTASVGYDGLEIAPFTLADSVNELTATDRKRLATAAERAGLEIVGLHWLLVKPEGLHLASPDESVRKATAAYLADLARFCADLGGKVMIFGSPKQRNLLPGVTYEQAWEWARETFLRALPTCAERGVKLCLEQLSTEETDFITTLDAAARFVDAVDHPNFTLMLDVKAISSLPEPPEVSIRKYGARAAHFHANDVNLQGPGFGEVDFIPIFEALKEVGYSGWVSVEVFDYSPGIETLAEQSLQYLKKCASEVFSK